MKNQTSIMKWSISSASGVFFFLVIWMSMKAQSPIYRYIATDTIVTKKSFAGTVYLLNGKKMNLAVMSWFMSDFPGANDKIQVASISNRLSNISYAVGGVFLLGGALAYDNNRPVSNDFFAVSGVAVGTGLLTQMITNFFKKESVDSYNKNIISIYQNGQAQIGVKTDHSLGSTIGILIEF